MRKEKGQSGIPGILAMLSLTLMGLGGYGCSGSTLCGQKRFIYSNRSDIKYGSRGFAGRRCDGKKDKDNNTFHFWESALSDFWNPSGVDGEL